MEPVEKAKAKPKGGKKPKGTRRRSGRFYVNVNRPVDPEAAALIDRFPPDEDQAENMALADVGKRDYSQSQRRRLAAEGKALPSGAYPIVDSADLDNAAVLARTGHGDAAAAKELIRRRARELGVPVPDLGDSAAKGTMGNPVDPMAPDGPRTRFMAHPQARGQAPAAAPWVTMRQRLGDNEFGDRTITRGPLGSVAMDRIDVASLSGFTSAPGNPVTRPADHIAPTGATSNGSHSLADPVSHGGMALKASDRVAIMRRHMFGGNGAR